MRAVVDGRFDEGANDPLIPAGQPVGQPVGKGADFSLSEGQRQPEGSGSVRAMRIVGVVLIVGTYFIFAPLSYLLFALICSIPTRQPARRARWLRFVMSRGFRFMHDVLRIVGIVDFQPRALARVIPPGPCVMVANHPTLMDISGLLAAEKDLVFPVKPSLYRSYWARPLLVGAEHFEGSGPDALSVGHMIDEAVARVKQGKRVIIFPEGTRSPETGLHPFGRAAFEIALRAEVDVVPVVVTCTPGWLTKRRGLLDPPADLPRLRFRPLDPIRPDQAGSSSRTLRDIVRDRILAELSSPRSTGAPRPTPVTPAAEPD